MAMNMTIEIEALAKIMFIDNVNDAQIELSLGGIENNKDLFYFCLDLFCKGLVLLFGSNNRVELDKLSIEQFEVVRKKMENAGVNVKLKLYQDIREEEEKVKVSVNISNIENLDDNLDLKEYAFVVHTPSLVYNINFELFHNTP